ncbi:MAG: hypothetical protein HWE10_01470 [Gammaproteobacteria bacterium]|nr:hypothetical protein [Gammaproteobacteria bacterium]
MEGFCFIITDKNHNIYYASDKLLELFSQTGNSQKGCFDYVDFPTSKIFKQMVEHDISTVGYFNGYMKLKNSTEYWFCDYGKRFDNEGNHVGFDALIYTIPDDVSQYMAHFYNNLEQRVNDGSASSFLDAYIAERQLVSENMNTDFAEFMIALQDKNEH